MQEVRVIRPQGRLPKLDLREIVRSRELLWVFVRRGIFSRYRQMALGIAWSFLEPLCMLTLVSLVFGLLIRIDTGPYPYPAFVFAGLIPWLYFSKATNGAAHSLHEHIGIISKIYFPRAILPLAAVAREFFDSLMLFVLLIAISWIYGFAPTGRVALIPLLFLYISIPALGIGFAVASISIKFRDFRPLLALALQAGFYLTPIFYPADMVPAALRPFYKLNPMYWGVEISRWIVLGKPLQTTPSLYLSLLVSALMLAIGYVIFAAYERSAVDAQ
jgi:lipopolysaccharide transport system permease protein